MAIWTQRLTPDFLNERRSGTLMHTLGIRITEIGDDFIRGTMPVDGRTRQPAGLLHGGASVALAETLGSVAAWMCIDAAHQKVVGVEVNANHVRSIKEGTVTGTARPAHVGQSLHVWTINIRDEEGQLVATSRLTVAVLRAWP